MADINVKNANSLFTLFLFNATISFNIVCFIDNWNSCQSLMFASLLYPF